MSVSKITKIENKKNLLTKKLYNVIFPSLLLSLCAAIGAYNISKNMILNNAELQFDNDSLQISSKINNEFSRYKELLYSTTAFVSSIDNFTQYNLKSYLNQLNWEKYPALYAFDYIEPIAHDNLGNFYNKFPTKYSDKDTALLKKISASIKKNLKNTLTQNKKHYVMSFYEPIEKGMDFIGKIYDSDSEILNAVIQGKKLGEITYSGKYYIGTDSKQNDTWVGYMRLASYADSKDISTFKGSVALGVRLDKNLFDNANSNVDYINYEVVDPSLKENGIIYDSRVERISLTQSWHPIFEKEKQASLFKKKIPLPILNHKLEIHLFTSKLPPNVASLVLANFVAGISFLASFALLFFLIHHWQILYSEKTKAFQIAKKINEELKNATYIDTLTGLHNRKAFWEDLSDLIKKHEHQRAYLLCLDMEGFKKINEVMGYSAGDEVLKQFTSRLKNIADPEESLYYRVGGNEFKIIIKNENHLYSREDIEHFAKRILKIVLEPFTVDESQFTLSLNIGISQYPIDGNNAEELSKNCDLAIYASQKKGKNTFSFYSEKVGTQIRHKNLIENLLLTALDKQEFYLMFQPKVEHINNEFKFVGAEVLIRWKNEKLGEVYPSDFIPVAEEIGMMGKIGSWVFEETVKKVANWNKTTSKPIKMSINLSVYQFINPNLVYNFMNILNLYNVSPEQIIIEITESTMMKDFHSSNSILKEFSENGFQISIDDFGTGYSSLSYLRKFSLDEIKIDKSFTNDVLSDDKDRIVIGGIIDLAQKLGLNVVVEGVETKDQLEWFQKKGQIQVQGYYFSKPLKEEDFINYWKNQINFL